MADLLSSNLVDKNYMKSDLTEQDPTGYPVQINAEETVDVAITRIVGKKTYLNDTFIASEYSHANSIIYDADEAFIIDNMETTGNWSSVGVVSVTIAADSTAGHYWVGANGTKCTWTGTTSSATIRSTQSYGDFSGATGAASGTPIQGTAGLWVYAPTGAIFSGVKLKLGSDSSNYKQYSAIFYSDISGVADSTMVYLRFDLDSPLATAGTVNWTAIDYVEIEWTVSAAGNLTWDYLNISKSNDVSLCGAGDRRTTVTEFTQTTGL